MKKRSAVKPSGAAGAAGRDTIAWLASFPGLNPNPVVEIDGTGRVWYVNPAAADLFPGLRRAGIRHPYIAGLSAIFRKIRRSGARQQYRELKVGGEWYAQAMSHVPGHSRVRIYGRRVTERRTLKEALASTHAGLELKVRAGTAALSEANRRQRAEVLRRGEMEERLRQSNLAQGVMNSLLRPSLKRIPLDALLCRALDLLFSIPWLSVEPAGSIFLVEEDLGALVLKASRGFSPRAWKECAVVPMGKCHCGRVAVSGRPRFAGGRDACRRTTVVAPGPHSHYCIPIMCGRTVLGVINLYLKDCRRPGRDRKEFLSAIANTLAGIIMNARTEQELLKTQKSLAEAKRLSDIGTLASTVAHELRNPLGVIKLAAHNIRRKSPDRSLDTHIASIEKKISESDQIINNLLYYSRIRLPQPEPLRIAEILDECVTQARRHAQPGVAIARDYGGLKGCVISADPVQLREVFNNILNNACESITKSRGRIEIAGTRDRGTGAVTVRVRDSGCGIATDDLQRIHEPFFTRKARGTGLGLAVSYQIVALHGGSIEVASTRGRGSAFTVSLPPRAANREP